MKLKDKAVFITGGARGLGKGFAQAALEGGAKGVVLVDLNVETGTKTAQELNSKFGANKAVFLYCDITDKQRLNNTFLEAVKTYGHLDIVVNNAGIGTNDDNFELIIDINLTALTRCTHLAVEHMRRDQGGKGGLIVNISSTAGLTVAPFEPVYAAAKHGVVGLSRSLAIVVEPLGIKITCLCPSFTKTDMFNVTVVEQETEFTRSAITEVGIMEISDVVKAFEKLVEDEHSGAVMSVSPRGIEYIYPRRLRAKKSKI